MEHFVWRPGVGIDGAALVRIRSSFQRPKKPMGEAWFMGDERRIFHELESDLSKLTVRQLQAPLQEIGSGTSSFGPYEEWHSWYHYLLGQVLCRRHESFQSSLLESLVTAFAALYPNGIHGSPYPEFQHDALQTLGQCMMDPECWSGNEIVVGRFLHRSNKNPNQIWGWWDASGDLSASLFFCLKYLPSSLVRGWFSSVLALESPHWRAQLVVWLVGAHDILRGRVVWPSEFGPQLRPSVSWDWSHCLRPELATSDESGASPVVSFLPELSRMHALDVVDHYFTDDVFLSWLDSIESVPYLKAELAEIPSTFEEMYVRRR